MLHEWGLSLAFYRGWLTFVTNVVLCPTAGAPERAAVILSFHWHLKMNVPVTHKDHVKKAVFFSFSLLQLLIFLISTCPTCRHWPMVDSSTVVFLSFVHESAEFSSPYLGNKSHSRMFGCHIKSVLFLFSFKCLKLALIAGIIFAWIIWKYTALGLCPNYCASFASYCLNNNRFSHLLDNLSAEQCSTLITGTENEVYLFWYILFRNGMSATNGSSSSVSYPET